MLAIRCPFLCMFHTEKKVKIYVPWTDVIKCVFVSDYLNDCIDDLLEKRYVTFMISWHISLEGNFLADTLRYLSWPPLSRSWHLAASGTGQGVMGHQTGCWPHCITVTQHPHLFSWARRQYGVHHELRVLRFWGTYSVLPDWRIKLARITSLYRCCIYSIVLQMNAGFPFPLNDLILRYRISYTATSSALLVGIIY